MSVRKFNKKLNLNKKTIVNLKHDEMREVHGGIGCTQKYSNCIDCSVPICHTIPLSIPC